MTKSWDDLYTKFPKIFRDIPFECGIGWYDILHDLAQQIELHMQACEVFKEYRDGNSEGFYVFQIKEKFGGLRFYQNGNCDDIHILIKEAENQSLQTCEVCGNPGKMRQHGGWLSTKCEDCYKKAEEKLSK